MSQEFGAPEFNEGFVSEHLDPLDGRTESFDYEAVDRALGAEPEGLTDEHFEALGKALARVLSWMADVKITKGAHELIGLRAVAAIWVVRPDLFDGLSQAELAELLGCKNRMDISRHASEFSKLFGMRNRGQSHGLNFQAEPTERPKRKIKPLISCSGQLALFSAQQPAETAD